MSKTRKNLIASFAFFFICALIVFTTSPKIESNHIIFAYFTSFYLFVYFLAISLMSLVGLNKQSSARASILSLSILILQVLATFNALRLVELVLVAVTISLSTWYFSRRIS